MANEYDLIFKENFEELLPFIAKMLLGIEASRWENLPTELPLTLDRQPDFLKKIYPSDASEPYLLHLEFQTKVDTQMPYRMLEYYALILKKYKTPIRQVVIQVGKPHKKESDKIIGNLAFSYQTINLQDIDYEFFLQSQKAEEVLLAVLANFKQTKPQKVLERLLARLQDLHLQKRFEQKYANQLFILSRIRNLDDETIKLLEKMPFHYNIEQDYLYKTGIKKGIERGIQTGMESKSHDFVVNLLQNTDFSFEKIALLAGVSVEFVAKVATDLS
jgi:hypothetical protein